jgi:hypothetical protein
MGDNLRHLHPFSFSKPIFWLFIAFILRGPKFQFLEGAAHLNICRKLICDEFKVQRTVIKRDISVRCTSLNILDIATNILVRCTN